jgi:hypothetical protein
MEPILVPGPPKQAFNKQRRMSDLIKAQVKHFKHLEEKLAPELRRSLPQHPIISEDDAARYIAPMTKLLLSRRLLSVVPSATTTTKVKTPTVSRPTEGLAIAAVAATDTKTTGKGKAAAKTSLPKSKRTK